MVVAGTDAAGTVLPHLARQLIAPRAQRADIAAQVETLVEAHPHVPGPDLHARDQGSRPQPSLLAETLDKDLQAPEPSWPPTPAWHR